ncbi:ERAD-associated E3 ubiquitin-protein ligase HRD1B [Capsicum annuum]|nr:ERAD-associated E3 ubiquitin-protein ligase HRD1B [Capsicum annuum]
MMRLQTYAGLSLIATLAVIYHAFNSRGQFYPAMVYLSTSKISLVLLLNMGLVVMCILWQLTKKIFLGPLREAEVERLNEQSWRELMEILFAITIFRQDFSVTFLAMVTVLLLIKGLHWLAQKRVEYIETTPTVTRLSHIRIVSFLGFLLLIDSLFLYDSVNYLIQTRQASVSLFFAFEYMILATTTVSTFVKYLFYISDMLMEGQWENKPVYTFYLELIRDLLHLSLYLCFFMVIFISLAAHCVATSCGIAYVLEVAGDPSYLATVSIMEVITCDYEIADSEACSFLVCAYYFSVNNEIQDPRLNSWERTQTRLIPNDNGQKYKSETQSTETQNKENNMEAKQRRNYGVPLHLIRELYETFRNFKIRVADYVRYRKITSNMNDRFPDATPEELNASDATCIICREEMTTAKKLICGHLFHVHCLRSWLERQHTCPTCRALVVPAENGTNVVGSRPDVQQGHSMGKLPKTFEDGSDFFHFFYFRGPGPSGASASQNSQADSTPNNNVSQHQARIQAAAAAAAVYQKSFVYPSVPTLAWSPGYAPVPPSYSPAGSSSNVLSDGERALNEQSLQDQLANMPLAQYQCGFLPFQNPGANNLSIPKAQLEAHKTLLQQQIEVLQTQLKILENPNTHKKADDLGSSDSKGKAIPSESSRGQSEGAEF